MERRDAYTDEPDGFLFQRLTRAYLDASVALCDQCVGKYLYPRAYLASILEDPAHFFYLLTTPSGEAAGYIYFFLTNLDEMAAVAKLPRGRLSAISPLEHPVVGNLQSIGVAPAWRGRGLSKRLVDFYLGRLRWQLSADAAFGVFWKPEGHVPMERTLNAFGFLHLEDAHRVWYDNEKLVCPYCRGRCVCDAAIYYKSLIKEVGI